MYAQLSYLAGIVVVLNVQLTNHMDMYLPDFRIGQQLSKQMMSRQL